LALDLDHADAAVAVRPVAGLGRVAQVRQLDVEAARGAKDGLVRADVDLAVVDEKGSWLIGLVHRPILSITNGPAAWRARRESISARKPAGSRRPGPARRSTRRASVGRARRAGPRPTGRAPSAWPPSRCRPGTACTARSSRPRRTSSG